MWTTDICDRLLIFAVHIQEHENKSLPYRMHSFKFEHSVRGHSSLSTVKEIIRVNKTASLRTITLCHLSEGWGNPEVMQNEIQDVAGDDVLVQIARPGLNVDLNLCPF